MDPLKKGIAIGMLFGSGSGNLMEKTATENGEYVAAEEIDPDTGEIFNPPKDGYSIFTVDLPLDSKSVTITTSNIQSSVGGIFNYDPHSENPELEGYDYFTVNLSGVKEDIEELQQQVSDMQECWEDVVEALQQYDPNYDPQAGECPSDEIPIVHDIIYQEGYIDGEASVALDAKRITINGTYPASAESPPLDGFSSVTVDVSPNVGPKFIIHNGTYTASSDNLDGYNTVVVDVQDCGYTFSDDVDDSLIYEVIGLDPLYLEGNTYHFDYYIYDRNADTHIPVSKTITYDVVANHTFEPRLDIIDENGLVVTTLIISSGQSYNVDDPNPQKYFKVILIKIDKTNGTIRCDTEHTMYQWGQGYVVSTDTKTTDISQYIDTQTQNPRWKVKNS